MGKLTIREIENYVRNRYKVKKEKNGLKFKAKLTGTIIKDINNNFKNKELYAKSSKTGIVILKKKQKKSAFNMRDFL